MVLKDTKKTIAAILAYAREAEMDYDVFGRFLLGERAIQTVLTNGKYIGHVLLGETDFGDFPNNKQRKNRGGQEQFLMKESHEPIIELEKFEMVQEEMKRRSNIEIVNGKTKRKGNHYSAKRKKED